MFLYHLFLPVKVSRQVLLKLFLINMLLKSDRGVVDQLFDKTNEPYTVANKV